MTNKEALIEEVALPSTDKLIIKKLMKTGLDEGAEYTNANEVLINQAALEVLKVLKTTKSIRIGDRDITVDTAAVNERIHELSGTAITVNKPTITYVGNRW